MRIDWQKNHIKSGCSAVGSARSLGLRCRRFKSGHSDQRLRGGCPGGVFLPISLFTAAQILTVYDAGFPLSGGSFPRRSPPSSVQSARTIFPRIPPVSWRRRFSRSACRRRLWANAIIIDLDSIKSEYVNELCVGAKCDFMNARFLSMSEQAGLPLEVAKIPPTLAGAVLFRSLCRPNLDAPATGYSAALPNRTVIPFSKAVKKLSLCLTFYVT